MGEIKVVNYPNHVTSIVYGDCLAFIRLKGIQNQCDFVKISISLLQRNTFPGFTSLLRKWIEHKTPDTLLHFGS